MKALLIKIRQILRDRRTRQFLTRFVSVTAAIVVFVTTYALVLPAITMESQAACGIEAHQHDDSCYTENLICGQEESEGHHHTEDCYTVTRELVCSLEEHQHSAENGCYDEDGNLICTLEEHAHTDSCYEEHRELTCGQEESEGHHHTDSCYEKVLTCGKEVHIHSAECYRENQEIQSAAVASTGMTSAAAVSDFSEEEQGQEESLDGDISNQSLAGSEEINEEDENTDESVDATDKNADEGIGEDRSETETKETETEDNEAADIDDEKTADFEEEKADDDSIAAEADALNKESEKKTADESEDVNLKGDEDTSADESADAFKTDGKASEESDDKENLNIEDSENTDREGEESASSFTTGFAAEEDEDSYIPEKEALDFNTVLNNRTSIYFYHLAADEAVEDSSVITDWTRVDEDTELGSEDLIRVYLSYTLPADTINATNDIARYRLPDTLHLTDEQVDTINKCENGISSQYVDYSRLEITDIERHAAYLGLESVEGTRTPDEELKEDSQEYISATVKAEKIYDEDDRYEGTDLIFTFSPYTVGKNAHAYDKDGQPTRAGEKVTGWLMLDFNMGQIDWAQDNTSEIVFAEEDEENHISGIWTVLRQADASEAVADDSAALGTTEAAAEYATEETAAEEMTSEAATTAEASAAEDVTAEASTADAAAGTATADTTEKPAAADNTSEKAKEAGTNSTAADTAGELNGDKADKEKPATANYPAVVFDDSITVRSGRLDTDLADTDLPKKTKMTVHVEADEGTFPQGTKMVLSPVEDLDAVAEAVGTAIDAKTRGFQAVDITFYDKDPSAEDAKEIEPLKPIRVSIKSDEIKKAAEDSSTAPVVVHIEDDKKATEIENKASKTDNSVIEIEQPGVEAGTAASVKDADAENPETAGTSADAESAEAADTSADAESAETPGTPAAEDSSPVGNTSESESDTAEIGTGDTIEFMADSFSVYAVVYTVDFHYSVNGETYDFSIPGGGFVTLQQLVEVLDITNSDADGGDDGADSDDVEEVQDADNNDIYKKVITLNDVAVSEKTREFVGNVDHVEFSNPELIWVGKTEESTTVDEIKETNRLECRFSAELTEEQINEINSSTVEAGDWALISLQPFNSKEELTITMKNGDQFVINVTDLNENPFGLNGKSFKIVNASTAMSNNVAGTTYGAGQVFGQTGNLSSGETWTFEYTGTDTKFLLKDHQGRYLVMVPNADSANGLVKGLQLTTNRTLAEMYPIVVQEVIDRNGTRGYALLDSTSTHALMHNNNSYYLAEENFAGNNTKPEYCMQLRDPSNTVKPGTVSTADTRSEGITINLFDYKSLVERGYGVPYPPYWITYYEDELDEAANAVPNAYNTGINKGHDLKFTSHGTAPSSSSNVSMNNWADPSMNNSKYVSIQGVVQSELENGYPKLATGSKENLGYLFNTTAIENAKDVYADVNHLFIKDERGYYRYNSDQNYAFYNSTQGGGDFAVYAGTFNEEGGDGHLNEAIGFFPFNDYDAGHTCIHGDGNDFYYYNGHNSSQTPGWYNHQFGMTLEANFVMTPDGKYLGDDIVFNFSGDDDLWVFVDGVLVLDIGGIHNPVAGSINFNSGKVTVRDDVNGGTPSQMVVNGGVAGPGSIEEAFERVTGKEWDDSPYTRHKLQVFYMERGGMYSNLSINFNLPVYKTVTVQKELDGLTEAQLETYNDEYFYYQVNIDGEPYTGPYGVLTRPATPEELANWEWDTEDHTSGHLTDGRPHTETINKNNELVKWHINVEDGLVRVKPGWYFTIEELPQNATFSVVELYGYNSAYANRFHDGQVDTPQTTNLMDPFLTPWADYRYKTDPLNPLIEEDLPLHEVTVDGRKAWSSPNNPEKPIRYSDWVLFHNHLATALQVEKVWYDREGNVVTHITDPINYKIHRIPYQIVVDDDPENETGKKRIDYPVQEVVDSPEKVVGADQVYVQSMQGYTGTLAYDGEHPENCWKEKVTGLPRIGMYTSAGQTDPIQVLFEYYVTEETHVNGYKHFIEGGEITDTDDPNYGEYSYEIKNEPLSPTDQQTQLDIEKIWEDDNDSLHKDDTIVFKVTQKKYLAEAILNGTKHKLYPITINLVDEGGHAGNPRETDTRVVYVPEGASFTLTPYYNDSGNENEHVVSVGGNGVIAGTTTGASPRTRTIVTSNGAPSTTYYYPNNHIPGYSGNSQLTFTFNNVNEAKEITLWLYAGNDEWVKLYDVDHPSVNYLDKTIPGGQSEYHHWTCELSSNGRIIWDIEEVLDNIVPGHNPNIDPNNLSDPVLTTPYEYTMNLTNSSENGLPTIFTNGVTGGVVAPGYAEGADDQTWKGSITELPRYEYKGIQNLPYIYTYEVTEARIGSETVIVSPVYGTEIPPGLYSGQTSQYLVKWNEQPEGYWKFTNKAKETTEVNASKKWVDPDGNPMTPPEGATVTFELFADGEPTGKTIILNGTTVTERIAQLEAITDMTEEQAAELASLKALTFGELTTAWKAEWKNLPKYKYEVIEEIPETAPTVTPNQTIAYTVKETVEYSGYQNMNPDGVGNNGEITNKQLKFSLKILKVDANNREKALSGATFQLMRRLPGESIFTKFENESFELEANNKHTGPFTVEATEGIILEGLIPGEYQIEEKTAPDGYIITSEPFTFTLTGTGTVTSSDVDNSLVVLLQKDNDNPAGLEIGNNPGAALPHTGGPGTKLFTILGSILLAFAGILLIRKHRTIY